MAATARVMADASNESSSQQHVRSLEPSDTEQEKHHSPLPVGTHEQKAGVSGDQGEAGDARGIAGAFAGRNALGKISLAGSLEIEPTPLDKVASTSSGQLSGTSSTLSQASGPVSIADIRAAQRARSPRSTASDYSSNHSAVSSHPPRSSVAIGKGRSAGSSSLSRATGVAIVSEGRSEAEFSGQSTSSKIPSTLKGKGKGSSRVSMIDFLSASTPENSAKTFEILKKSDPAIGNKRPLSLYAPLIPNDPTQPDVSLPAELFRKAERPMNVSLKAQGKARAPTRTSEVEEDSLGTSGLTAFEFLSREASLPPSSVEDRTVEPKPDLVLLPTRADQAHSNTAQSSFAGHDERVHITVLPAISTITMFGTTQTSANYSLSGRIVVEVRPVAERRDHVKHSRRPQLSSRSRSSLLARSSPSSLTTSTETTPRFDWMPLPSPSAGSDSASAPYCRSGTSVRQDSPASRPGGDGAERETPTVLRFTSLKVMFVGYAYYCDTTGRFAGVKLANVVKELLPQGYSLPLDRVERGDPQRFEIEFDLGVPGWLPGSMRSRFGANFYTVSAEASYQEEKALDASAPSALSTLSDQSQGLGLESADEPMPFGEGAPATDEGTRSNAHHYLENTVRPVSGSPGRSEISGFALVTAADEAFPAGQRRPLRPRTSSISSASASPRPTDSEIMPAPRSESATTNHSSQISPSATRSRSSWLARSSRRIGNIQNVASSSAHVSPSITRSQSPASQSSPRAKSSPIVIVIKRCRDVVPVPVARLAQAAFHDDGGASTVPSTSMHANSRAEADASSAIMTPTQRPPDSNVERTSPLIADNNTAEAADGMQSDVTPASIPAISAHASETATLPSDSSSARPQPPAFPPAPMLPTTADRSLPTDLNKFAAAARSRERTVDPTASSRDRIGERTTSSYTSGPEGRGSTPMRHFLHRPVLHPPTDAGIGEEGLPFSLTLSLPSHVQINGPDGESLSFGVQIEVGRTAVWNVIKDLGGLRLRDMELACLQTERHSSVASRSFGMTFTIPPNPEFSAEELPMLPDVTTPTSSRLPGWHEARLRQGYDRSAIEQHMHLIASGHLDEPEEQNVERSRTSVVGPPPTLLPESSAHPGAATAQTANKNRVNPKDKKGKGKSTTMSSTDVGASGSMQAMAESSSRPSAPADTIDDGLGVVTSSVSVEPARKQVSRGRRVYNNALNRLSNFATAMLDVGADEDNGEQIGNGWSNTSEWASSSRATEGLPQRQDRAQRQPVPAEQEPPRATYSFTGDDEHGVDLTRGRIRMTITLPLVTSSHSTARKLGTPQLLADSESPFFRIRHKLRVKLSFGFGGVPLGGEGDWGQSLVMCVPVRFTEAPPEVVQRHFAPRSISLGPSHRRPSLSLSRHGDSNTDVPILPAYTQLFREDGSRLADEGEDLPQYPGRQNAPPDVLASMRQRGSVTGPDFPALLASTARGRDTPDTNRSNGNGDADHSTAQAPLTTPSTLSVNRIAPSHVVDEEEDNISTHGDGDNPGHTRIVSQEQRREIEEMLSETDDDGQLATRRTVIGEDQSTSTEEDEEPEQDEVQEAEGQSIGRERRGTFGAGNGMFLFPSRDDEMIDQSGGQELDLESFGNTQDGITTSLTGTLDTLTSMRPNEQYANSRRGSVAAALVSPRSASGETMYHSADEDQEERGRGEA